MTSCPWLQARDLNCARFQRLIEAHTCPAAMDAAEAVQGAAERLAAAARARPQQSLLIAVGLGLALGLVFSGRRG